MKLLYYSLAIYLSLSPAVSAASRRESGDAPALKPCTAISSTTKRLFDLSTLQIPRPEDSKLKNPRTYSYNASGYDIGYNFTLNICGAVIEPIREVVGIEESLHKNVSAYYKHNGKFYSLGFQNSEPVMRGRKLVLNYTDGSPCEPTTSRSRSLLGRAIIGDDDDDEQPPSKKPSKGKDGSDSDDDDKKDGKKNPGSHAPSGGRRKNTIISMLCDQDPLAPQLQLSFIGSPDECTYIFEGRSAAACASAAKKPESVGPWSIFGIIALIAVLVYVVGGCVYSRMVLQQRGWRQLPNYALWASIFGFFKDIFIILTSSCARFLPSRRGYSRVNGGLHVGGNSNGGLGARGRGRSDSEVENRLIDELNEEWED